MKFAIAQRELKKLAQDKYHVLQFEKAIYPSRMKTGSKTECAVYVEGHKWYTAPTWKEALGLLRKELNGYENQIEETPDVEDTNED